MFSVTGELDHLCQLRVELTTLLNVRGHKGGRVPPSRINQFLLPWAEGCKQSCRGWATLWFGLHFFKHSQIYLWEAVQKHNQQQTWPQCWWCLARKPEPSELTDFYIKYSERFLMISSLSKLWSPSLNHKHFIVRLIPHPLSCIFKRYSSF